MSFNLGFFSCMTDQGPIRMTDIAQQVKAIYWMGDLVYMDATIGATAQWKYGMNLGAGHWPATGSGFTCTVGASVTANGVAGQLPTTGWTITSPGTGYPESQVINFNRIDFELVGQDGNGTGATGFAITHLVFNPTLSTSAVSGTLQTAPAAGNGTYTFTFNNGNVRTVTVTGTSCTWSGGLTAAASQASDGLGMIQAITPTSGGRGYTNTGTATMLMSRHNGTVSNWVTRAKCTLTGHKEFSWFTTNRKSLGVKWYFMPDDHEYSNNWDHSPNQAPGQNPFPAMTNAQVLQYWRTANAAWKQVIPTYFDNTISAGQEVPPSMVGVTGTDGVVASAADYPTLYYSHDYDYSGNLIANGNASTALAVKCIVIDCISAKSPIRTADSISKQMIGPIQEAWIYAQAQDAMNRGAKHIYFISGKDFFNIDNTDGWGVPQGVGVDGLTHYPYIFQRDRIMSTLFTMGAPVLYISGDRHCSHLSMRSVANGDTYNAAVLCAAPFGAQSMGLTTTGYNELISYDKDVDPIMYGTFTFSEERQSTILRSICAITGDERHSMEIAWGQQLPTALGIKSRRKVADK